VRQQSAPFRVSREQLIGSRLRGEYASRTRDGVQALRERACPPSGKGRDAGAASNSSHAMTGLTHTLTHTSRMPCRSSPGLSRLGFGPLSNIVVASGQVVEKDCRSRTK
jgi:hypothetical protein